MKRILTFLMAFTLTSSTIVTVSCQSIRTNKIELNFSGNKKFSELENYDISDLRNAFNGSKLTPYNSYAPFSVISRDILRLLSFDNSQITKPSQIFENRKTFVGNDSETSVDGIFFDDIDKDREAFYNKYENTQINSLRGLYDLYNYGQGLELKAKGAKSSYDLMKKLFESNNKNDANGFFNSFLNLGESNYDSHWISQNYDLGSASKPNFKHLDSFVVSYNETTNEDKNSEYKSEYKFKSDEKMKDLGTYSAYSDLNTVVDKSDIENPEKIGNDYKKPFDLYILNTKQDYKIPKDSNGKSDALKIMDDEPFKPTDIDGNKVWNIRTPDENGNVDWRFNVTTKDFEFNDRKTKGFIQTNESVILPLEPFVFKYEYTTNIRKSDAIKYEIDITIDGLYAVFTIRNIRTEFKDKEDAETRGNSFLKWQFTNYQFTNRINTLINTTNDLKKDAGYGYYSNIKIKEIKIKEISKK